MTVPGIVQSTLEGEEIAARVPLGGDDELFITPSRTIIYRAEGLLSDESVDTFSHDADRLSLSEGRRKTRFTLEYALDGEREFTIPGNRTDEALHPVLAGVLTGNDITDSGESVLKTFRFSELTLIITSDRLVKHIGEAVWDSDFEQYHYADVTNLSFEDGSVATQVVLGVDGRQQRIKAPNDQADEVAERLKRALCSFHDVETLEELNALLAADDDDADEPTSESASGVDFGIGVDPLDANPREPDDLGEEAAASQEPTETDPSNDPLGSSSAFDLGSNTDEVPGQTAQQQAADGDLHDESSVTNRSSASAGAVRDTSTADPSLADPELLERIESLESAVEAQTELLEAQQATIEQLIEELRQGR
ncbi:DUF7115 domain-containing protein [Natronosalvus halobius]|uniref:DUF7115 domain-containing protein n=1 Tax=Natronosalvus halobius TaxID=2953746 RepID=UPI0020A191CA|nr:hypothetical protein [Natronosalvus halobius]USZ72510.1 hypothetical protein NGM15_04125 [Natronosalvus halobius]